MIQNRYQRRLFRDSGVGMRRCLENLEKRLTLTATFVQASIVTRLEIGQDQQQEPFVVSEDMDGDGDVDIVVSHRRGVELFVNNGDGIFNEVETISNDYLYYFDVADIDGNGLKDLVGTRSLLAGQSLAFMHTDVGWGQLGIDNQPRFVGDFGAKVALADRDNDGDVDLIAYSSAGTVFWQENVDGEFSSRQYYIDHGINKGGLATSDFDGDGIADIVVSGGALGLSVIPGSNEWIRVQDELTRTHPIAVGDLDSDGDDDIFSFTFGYQWFENRGGSFSTASNLPVAASAEKLAIVDVDGDGVNDFVASTDEGVLWWKNLGDGRPNDVAPIKLVADAIRIGEFVFSPFTFADFIDGGGVEFAAVLESGDLTIFELDRSGFPHGDFNRSGVVDSADIDLLYAAFGSEDEEFDLNADDEINRNDVDFLVENILDTTYGDIDLNGTFDSTDLVLAFQLGRYETGAAAGWSGGDWNGDSVFDSSDLVLAFSKGSYV